MSDVENAGDQTLKEPELRNCPHCGGRMLKWYTPPALTWGTPYQYVCFNDECGYYVRGWKWLEEHYHKKASYRHRLNPFTGETGPVPVWSERALRARIMEENETVDQFVRRTGGGES